MYCQSSNPVNHFSKLGNDSDISLHKNNFIDRKGQLQADFLNVANHANRVFFLSKNRPLADSFIESRCLLACLSPSHAIFFCVWELVQASLVPELVHASVAIAWSPKNGEVFRIGPQVT